MRDKEGRGNFFNEFTLKAKELNPNSMMILPVEKGSID